MRHHAMALREQPFTVPIGHPEGFVFPKNYTPPFDWDDPTLHHGTVADLVYSHVLGNARNAKAAGNSALLPDFLVTERCSFRPTGSIGLSFG